jgi:diguanylate cyclase (GGDEF)-like protein
MDTEVERCVRNDETISILLIEVNDLPARIEQAGHRGGEELIRGIARVVADHTRASDITCRYGNCGFFMLCRRATIANAVALADDLQRNLAEHSFVVHGQPQHVTASIGVATIPGVHRVASAANLVDCADEALRHSRQTGHAVVHYSMLERQARPAAL